MQTTTSNSRTYLATPICGVAMLASKSNPDSADFDTFDCLSCKTKISVMPVRAAIEPEGRNRAHRACRPEHSPVPAGAREAQTG